VVEAEAPPQPQPQEAETAPEAAPDAVPRPSLEEMVRRVPGVVWVDEAGNRCRIGRDGGLEIGVA